MRSAPGITRLVEDTDDTESLDDEALAAHYAAPASPWLRVNFVASVDGAVEVKGRSGPLSDPEDQRLMQVLRTRCDAVLLGAGTFRIERYGPRLLTQPRLAWRREQGLPEHPRLVIVSRSLRLDPQCPAFAEATYRPIVITTATAPEDRRAALSATAEVLIAGERSVDLTAAVALLHERGLHQLLSEGGPHLFGGLTAAGLVDEVCLTLSPMLTGPGAGRITAGPTCALHNLTLVHVLTAGDSLLLRYSRAT